MADISENKSKARRQLPRLSAAKIVVFAASLIAVYFVVGGALNAVRSHHLRQEESQLREDVDLLQSRYDRLTALKDYLNSDEYIETVAREQLGLVRKGETGFLAISTVPTPTPAPDEEKPSLWWDVLIR
jgi:cell division protein FtsB